LLLAAAALTGQKNIKSTLAVAVTLLAAVALARFCFGDFSDWGAAVRRVVIYRIDSIAYGFLLYLLTQHLIPAYFARLSIAEVTAFLATSTIMVFWASSAISKHDSFLAKQLFPWLAPLFGSACILLALKMERAVASRTWLAKICLFGGRISYSVYLFHMIFLIVLGSTHLAQPTTFRFVAYVAIVALFAALFYWSFEKPFLLARPRLAVAVRSAQPLGREL
jgi:peptidoglycan/LPS O-acetylase OafA/YrhL